MQNKTFNLIISGVGGQGIITLVSILDETCFIEGYDVRSSELHGLSQRGGSVVTHIRFGKKVFSPMVGGGQADLIIGLELLETLREFDFAGPETEFIANKNMAAFSGSLPEQEILGIIQKVKKMRLVPASEVCREKLQKDVLAGIFLIGFAVSKKLIPLQSRSVLMAMQNVIPQKYREENIKAFNLGTEYDN